MKNRKYYVIQGETHIATFTEALLTEQQIAEVASIKGLQVVDAAQVAEGEVLNG